MLSFKLPWRCCESRAPSTALRAVPLPRFAGADANAAMTSTPRPRLYLVTPSLGDTASFLRDLGPVLDAGDIAAVLLRLEPADERTLTNRAKSIATVVQRRDVALLLDGYPTLAARAGADGAHLFGIEALTEAAASLKPDRIAGAGGLRSRHDAMLAGETGADYVMFGDPDRRGDRPPLEAVTDRLTWWSELIEIPCVGYAGDRDEIAPLVQAGADFIALGEWLWMQEQGPAAGVAAVTALLAQAPVAQAD
jgi:thiamine-phosphate pyrophosphorylase